MFNAKKWIDKFDRWMIAITFAEAGDRERALNVLNERPRKKRVVSRTRKHVEQRPVLRV